MQLTWIILVVLGIIIFKNPDIIAYVISAILVTLGCSILLVSFLFKKWTKESIKFWWYEIYRNKK